MNAKEALKELMRRAESSGEGVERHLRELLRHCEEQNAALRRQVAALTQTLTIYERRFK